MGSVQCAVCSFWWLEIQLLTAHCPPHTVLFPPRGHNFSFELFGKRPAPDAFQFCYLGGDDPLVADFYLQRVTAHFTDGHTEDYTHQAMYTVNDGEVVSAATGGLVSAKRRGETSILVRAAGQVASAGVGVRFIDMNEDERAQLEEFVRQRKLLSFVPLAYERGLSRRMRS